MKNPINSTSSEKYLKLLKSIVLLKIWISFTKVALDELNCAILFQNLFSYQVVSDLCYLFSY